MKKFLKYIWFKIRTFNMTLVKIDEKGYGIRYGVLGLYVYNDFKFTRFKWSHNDIYFKDCITSFETANEFYKQKYYKVTPKKEVIVPIRPILLDK